MLTAHFSIRLHVIVRETESEAWDAANRLIQYVDEEAIASLLSVSTIHLKK